MRRMGRRVCCTHDGTRDVRPTEISILGGLRGGASATAGSATPGGMEPPQWKAWQVASAQRRDQIGSAEIASEPQG